MGLCTPFLLSDLPIRSEIGNGSFLGNAIGKRAVQEHCHGYESVGHMS